MTVEGPAAVTRGDENMGFPRGHSDDDGRNNTKLFRTATRRQFLTTAAALATAAVTSRSTASGPAANTARRTFRVAVIGSTGRGNYGHDLDRAWLEFPECRIVAVTDDNPDGLAAAVKRLGTDRGFADYRQMLDQTEADIVAVCPRWIDRHRDMAVAAAERGLHVFIEKPFCRTPAEADEIIAACRRTGARLAVGHPTPYSPKFATLKRLIAEGAIGRVLEFRGRGKEDRRGGAEDLWVLGSHVLDMVRHLGGRPAWCFANLTQQGLPARKADVRDGAEGLGPLAGDGLSAMYGMPDGSTACFASYKDMAGRPSRYGLTICGSEGQFELLEGPMPSLKYLGDPGWSPGRSGKQWQDVSSAGIGQPEPLTAATYQSRYHVAIRDFLDAISDDRDPLDGPGPARDVVEMIAAVFDSHRRRSPVALPLKERRHALELLDS